MEGSWLSQEPLRGPIQDQGDKKLVAPCSLVHGVTLMNNVIRKNLWICPKGKTPPGCNIYGPIRESQDS